MLSHRFKKYYKNIVSQDMVLACQPNQIAEIPIFVNGRVIPRTLSLQEKSKEKKGISYGSTKAIRGGRGEETGVQKSTFFSESLFHWHMVLQRGKLSIPAFSSISKTSSQIESRNRSHISNLSRLVLQKRLVMRCIEKWHTFALPYTSLSDCSSHDTGLHRENSFEKSVVYTLLRPADKIFSLNPDFYQERPLRPFFPKEGTQMSGCDHASPIGSERSLQDSLSFAPSWSFLSERERKSEGAKEKLELAKLKDHEVLQEKGCLYTTSKTGILERVEVGMARMRVDCNQIVSKSRRDKISKTQFLSAFGLSYNRQKSMMILRSCSLSTLALSLKERARKPSWSSSFASIAKHAFTRKVRAKGFVLTETGKTISLPTLKKEIVQSGALSPCLQVEDRQKQSSQGPQRVIPRRNNLFLRSRERDHFVSKRCRNLPFSIAPARTTWKSPLDFFEIRTSAPLRSPEIQEIAQLGVVSLEGGMCLRVCVS